MSGVLSILIIVVCALLILIVLVQNSKGGGLSSSFASNNQIMGVRKTADFLEKTTWGFAIALFVLSLLASPKKQAVTDTPETGTESVTRQKGASMNIPTPMPQAPAGANSGATNPQQQPPAPPK
ncbi:MAG TPA: preprotein translocase subunit SecG [Bacteroidia bacterium]|jgi:preprotein translocase subunit SecG|nr:preprotein translocase subunit SecG [Bacteroidia bacterium]